MSHLDEIKLKLSIEELVAGYLPLKKAGRNLKGLCPFHNDSRPSFMVSPEKGIAYCFSCNTGGDIFKFIQLVEKVEFAEAVKILAQKTNVKLPDYNPKQQDARQKTLELNQWAIAFFQRHLHQNPAHQTYFLNRGLTPETLQQFQLGYSPDSYQALKNELFSKGAQEADLVEAGLTNQRSIADKSSYDRFRHRLIFPLFNAQGQPVGFAGRVLDDSQPKYLNSPDTPAYQKSHVVYGLHWAKEAIKKEDLVIVVEGYMDVISAHQFGSQNTVASSGTALSPTQLKLLKRYTKNIAFAFDQDPAGQQATERAILLAQEAGFNISIISIPEGKDPDECIQKNPHAWVQSIADRMPVMDFYFKQAFDQQDPKTLEGKKAIAQILLPFIKALPSHMEKGHYLERLALALKTDPKWLWHDLNHLKAEKSYASAPKTTEKLPQKKYDFPREVFLMGLIAKYPQAYPVLSEHLMETLGLNPELEKFYRACKNVYNRLSLVSLQAIKTELLPEEAQQLEIYSLLVEVHYPDFPLESALKEVRQFVREINQENLKRLQKEYIFKLKNTKDPQETQVLIQEYHQILTLKGKL